MINLTGDKKVLITNFLSLSALQGVNMVLPLIVLPYLVRVLGVEKFGLINFALSIIMYFSILVGFGFDLSATREISLHRDDKEKISEIFSSVMFIKLVLMVLSLIGLTLLVFFIGTIRSNYLLYYATFGIVIGDFLFPSWFFLGMERMKHITYITVTTKIVFTSLIFFLVKDSTDFIFVPFLNSLAAIFGGIYSLYLVYKIFSIKLTKPSKKMLKFQFQNSLHFFLSRVANNGSRYYATTLIGLSFGNLVVGYYVMAEKLFFAFMSLGGLVSQTIYPYMSRTKNLKFFKKTLTLVTSGSMLVIIMLMIFNKFFLSLVFNIENEVLSNVFLIVFSGAIFGIISTLIGYPFLAAFGYIKEANNSLIIASIIYMIYITFMSIFFNDIYYIAASLVVYNLFSVLIRSFYVYKRKIFIVS